METAHPAGTSTAAPGPAGGPPLPDATEQLTERTAYEPVQRLLRDLRTSEHGLSSREAARRLQSYGPNTLPVLHRRRWWRELTDQLVHPLALLLWAAAVLSAVTGSLVLAAAIVAVIVLNAAFAFAQERQAERAVSALGAYLPPQTRVVRDGEPAVVGNAEVVPGDVLDLAEGDRIPADARLLSGDLQVDMSALTGESAPVTRSAAPPSHVAATAARLVDAPEVVFSGTSCTGGVARAVVVATGRHSELGRIAALSQRVRRERSPLETQVRRVAWLIATVAVVAGAAFLPLGMIAGLSLHDSYIFAVGLLVANVPEGLLPTITLALAVGVRELAERGAVVKRLSAVETLGSTTVICTDKTGTLTENRMRVVAVWTPGSGPGTAADGGAVDGGVAALDPALADAVVACTTAHPGAADPALAGDPTELALLGAAAAAGRPVDPAARDAARLAMFAFDPELRRMATVSRRDGGVWVDVKGAPEAVLPLCGTRAAEFRPDAWRARANAVVDGLAGRGLRVLAVASRRLPDGAVPPATRGAAESRLTLLGVLGLLDPPRPEVASAVRTCHRAGVRIHVVTGDHGRTAAEVAREVGIGTAGAHVLTGAELARLPERDLDELLAAGPEIVFARTTPEDKLRIADALKSIGQVVAMTGDGVNDAPALHRADIGVAMGRTGTDVAREAATMVLTDDNFATIVDAIEAGRRVFDNVRKFIVYIFAHAVPEVVPFVVFALSGGAVPLPLTVLQILAIDLGTETLPALALGREPGEPGLMTRAPRARSEGVIDRALLGRAWLLLGSTSAALVMGGFLFTLWRAGWQPGDPTAAGTPLHHAYLQATTATFAGIVACQVGTAFAARTERASLRAVGALTNPLLLAGIAFELLFTAVLVYVPPVAHVFGAVPLPADVLALLAAFPVVVWGVDEIARALRRRRAAR